MTVVFRLAETDEDVRARRQVPMAVLPCERANPVESVRARAGRSGVEIVRVSERPGLWRAVYPVAGAQAFQDIVLTAAGGQPGRAGAGLDHRPGCDLRRPGRRRGHRLPAEHGLREVCTWAQRGNDRMRALNTHLGFATGTASRTMRAGLPLKDNQ